MTKSELKMTQGLNYYLAKKNPDLEVEETASCFLRQVEEGTFTLKLVQHVICNNVFRCQVFIEDWKIWFLSGNFLLEHLDTLHFVLEQARLELQDSTPQPPHSPFSILHF
jgi:hypothetical protein